MRNYISKIFLWILISSSSLLLMKCGSSNNLREYEFRDLTAAAVISAPIRAEVFTGFPLYVDKNDPIGSVFRIGANLAKEIEAEKARERLDSAMTSVNVPERIRDKTVKNCSMYLHYRPIEDYHDSDFLFNIYIENYGLETNSWESNVYFKIEIKVHLLDNKTGMEIWKTGVKERTTLSGELFDSRSYTADNVLTAIALSKLSVEEMVKGFQYLADYSADRISKKLQNDFLNSRKR